MRRVVVTGLGMVTPLACGTAATWQRLLGGETGVGVIEDFDVSDIDCKIAARVPRGDAADAFDPDDWIAPRDGRKLDEFILYALAAAAEAIADAGWSPDGDEAREHAGVIVGSGVGALKSLADAASTLEKDGPRRVSPQFVRSMCINLAAGYISILHGLKGPNRAVATSCAAGAHAIGDAARLIRHGDADVMVAGGAEAAVCRLGLAGFAAAGALSTRYNARPGKASRPWDRDRDGLVIGDGAGVVVLEELAHARRRGARIYAELAGYGLSGDAHHITAPSEFGHGECRAIRAALNDARMTPEAVDYINANSA